jgi:hypothetical protein
MKDTTSQKHKIAKTRLRSLAKNAMSLLGLSGGEPGAAAGDFLKRFRRVSSNLPQSEIAAAPTVEGPGLLCLGPECWSGGPVRQFTSYLRIWIEMIMC